ncbi:MAG: biotin-dependent carboxyltransferase family protein [Ilumatobacteraceae bacterium]
MTRAVLVVEHAGPLVTFQDGGRPGRMRWGVPTSGPMDRVAHAAGNLALGRPAHSTAVEISLAGLTVRCREAPLTVSVCGGAFHVDHEGRRCDPWHVLTLRPDETLEIAAGSWGAWCYLAVSGDLVARRWMGSTSTHVRAGLGGGIVRSGDELVVVSPTVGIELEGPIQAPPTSRPCRDIRAVLGPQQRWFTPHALEAFRSSTFRVSSAFDRMGMRLDGPALAVDGSLDLPSTPVVRGAVQVNGEGVATLLMADHQTTGGYPKIATALSSDAVRAAQLRPGDEVAFRPVEPEEAVRLVRLDAERLAGDLAALADRPGVRSRRLLEADLIGSLTDEAPT